jgi:hypothetical protein
MLDLAGQVQRASDTSKLSGQRPSGVASPPCPTPKSLSRLIKRVADTVAYLQTLDERRSREARQDRRAELRT